MENELVRYSRAGDVFHYRWAARRCLRMIYPKSLIRSVVIEGSSEQELDGEYVIDVTEYSDSEQNGSKEIAYFQLKHTVVRKEQPFSLSELKKTIEGFAKRYLDLRRKMDGKEAPTVTFSIVSNRPISEGLKQEVLDIASSNTGTSQIQKTLEEYTNLLGTELIEFCSLIRFVDGEDDYDSQRFELHREISELLAGTVDNPQVDSITSLVQDKALPNSDGRIVREDILKRFGVTSERDLYPAPPEFENIENVIVRKQHQIMLDAILSSSTPILIHAVGGVGKSVFARQIVDSLPIDSFGIVFDCFGGGRYRNRSEPRHRHRDALIQIANELAAHGLCAPLIAQSVALEDEILKKFLSRLDVAATSLRKTNPSAKLIILIDAADNAEMAAREFGQPCFVHEILREQLPEGCRLVALCRTERIQLLEPSKTIPQIQLESFSPEETLAHLRRRFANATDEDGLEFHRLTNGNPRVQANVLSIRFDSTEKVFASLGPAGTTVEEQIESQLDLAVASVKESLSLDFQKHIDAICTGLATLPPFIPLVVLAAAADVGETTVRSFVSDLGRPLWISDTSVQFRDEPTETWFREKFSATIEQVSSYIERLKPVSHRYSYVAETLPYLFLRAQKYSELIDLALSDDFLPQDNPIDQRNVRVYRLQFAFKAALTLKRYGDATKLALRAGEEVAGDKRQIEILKKNVDLIAPLQSEQRVQELAFRRLLRSGWEGSENVYSAALLSSVQDFKGEARGYLRAANNWLRLYFDSRKEEEKNRHQEQLTDDDIVELAFAHYNLFGVVQLVDFILSWRPPQVTYRVAKKFIKRLIDASDFGTIDEILDFDCRGEYLQYQYLIIAAAHELVEVGAFPSEEKLQLCLDLLANRRTRIPKPGYLYDDTTAAALVSFLEVCAARNLSKAKIFRVLRHYIPSRASRSVSSNFQERERATYLRAIALGSVLMGNLEPNLDELLPKEFSDEKNYRREQDIREFKQIVGGLLPWHIFRTRILINDTDNILDAIKETDERSKKARTERWHDSDTLSYEISQLCIEIVALCRSLDPIQVAQLFADYLEESKHIWIQDRLRFVRAAYRLDHLSEIRMRSEQDTYNVIVSLKNEGPETRAEWFIELARSVFPKNRDDAAAYFDSAIEAVSKFGDELVQRWEAVAALANRVAHEGNNLPEMAYRFIRCAELVGDNVAREKHWDREEAIRICTRLSGPSALAAVSRWRDRDVGWFGRQLPALADELVRTNSVLPSVGWSLSAFFAQYSLERFASLCIEKETSQVNRQYILDTAVRDLGLAEAQAKSWHKLKEVAHQYAIENSSLNDVLVFFAEHPENKSQESGRVPYSSSLSESQQVDWEGVLNGLELTTSSGISDAINRFDAASTTVREHEKFWNEVFKRIDEGEANQFLLSLVYAESADRYDVEYALSCMPKDWRQKISVKRNWNKVLELIARRFASEFTIHWVLESFLKAAEVEKDSMPSIYSGILEGLSNQSDLVDASTFFGFVQISSTLIYSQEVKELLHFALARFELHIDTEYADGPWADWLCPPEEPSMAFAGFVWSALGSPRAETRWQAAHCVRRLAETGCESEIESLIQWMEHDKVDAFGSHKFPFYNLHARQYLLIALARVAIDDPQKLRSHHAIFAKHALASMSHVLIQKFSAEIALRIEGAFPNTYPREIIEQLSQVGISKLPKKELDRFGEKLESSWHLNRQVDTSLKFYHGYDFDSYWFDPLGDVFGISSKQVEELATEVVVKEWHVSTDGSLQSDPRAKLWRSSRNERETWHDHGGYPRADNYSFYLSYHAMFVVAAKLVEAMPVVHRRDWYENEWAEWLHRHSLTRKDGKWLADRRDPAPLLKPEWTQKQKTKDWRSEITPLDFLNGILFDREGEAWLNICGWWSDGDSEVEESFHISSALVSPSVSQSLLNALTTCSDPHDFKLPDYQEERMEFNSFPFELQGWIWREDKDKCLDESDPHAAEIPFPPYQLGQSIIERFGLSVDLEARHWYLPNQDKASLKCEIWSTNKPRPDEEPLRSGNRLQASLSFLKLLCSSLGRELIFEVQVSRRLRHSSYARDEKETGYTPPHNKIYVLSGDGQLRDTESYYQLG